MRSDTYRRAMRGPFVLLGIVAALLISACGSGGGNGDDAGESGGQSPNPGDAIRVSVVESEFSISLPESEVAPGVYTFAVENAGAVPHDLVVKGPGVNSARTQRITGGGTGTVTVTLTSGTYELWCSIGNHREQGMDTALVVR